jgi:hypothetical protein
VREGAPSMPWLEWQKAWMPTVVGMTGRRPAESRPSCGLV